MESLLLFQRLTFNIKQVTVTGLTIDFEFGVSQEASFGIRCNACSIGKFNSFGFYCPDPLAKDELDGQFDLANAVLIVFFN